MLKVEELTRFVDEAEQLLKEIRQAQIENQKVMEQYHKVNMRNFAKLKEYNEIADMTNQVFEKRIAGIEQILQK